MATQVSVTGLPYFSAFQRGAAQGTSRSSIASRPPLHTQGLSIPLLSPPLLLPSEVEVTCPEGNTTAPSFSAMWG